MTTQVIISLVDSTSETFFSKIYITPLQTPMDYSGSIVVGDSISTHTDQTAETCTVNLIPQEYKIRCIGNNSYETSYNILVPISVTPVYAGDIIINYSSGSATSASYSHTATSASYALTASYALNGGGSGASASYADQSLYSTVTKEPMGFLNKTDSTLSYVSASRTFTIAPTTTSYDFFSLGLKYTVTGSLSVTIPAVRGQNNFVYFDKTTRALTTGTATWDMLSGDVPIAEVYMDGLGNGFLSEERHGVIMDTQTHVYLHSTFGARYANGFSLTMDGSLGAHTFTSGAFFDEDNEHKTTANTTQSYLGYYSSSMIVSTTASSSLWHGTPQWNNVSTGVRTTIPNGSYGAFFVYAVNTRPMTFLSVMGQRVDNTLSQAQANNVPESLILGNFPFAESKLLYRVIVAGTDKSTSLTDYRTTQYGGNSTFSVIDHGLLSGLQHDDHLQYLLLDGRTGGQSVSGSTTISDFTSSFANFTNTVILSGFINKGYVGTPYSNFIGYGAGAGATLADGANFIGRNAGNNAVDGYNSVFIGSYAGDNAASADYAVYIGYQAGYQSTVGYSSIFMGDKAGYQASNAARSIFLGNYAGYQDTVDNSGTGFGNLLIGHYSRTYGYQNSITIGFGCGNSSANQINFGNSVYITGSYHSDSTSNTVVTTSKVGIGTSTPLETLHVNGNVRCDNIVTSPISQWAFSL